MGSGEGEFEEIVDVAIRIENVNERGLSGNVQRQLCETMLTCCGRIFPTDDEGEMRVSRVHFKCSGNRHFFRRELEWLAGIDFYHRRWSGEHEAERDCARGRLRFLR